MSYKKVQIVDYAAPRGPGGAPVLRWGNMNLDEIDYIVETQVKRRRARFVAVYFESGTRVVVKGHLADFEL